MPIVSIAPCHWRVALPGAFDDDVAAVEATVGVAPVELEFVGDVVRRILVDERRVLGDRLVEAEDGWQDLVLDRDELGGPAGGLDVGGGDGGDLVADVADLLDRQRVEVRAERAPLLRAVSSPVMTACTPGSRFAREVSIERMRALAWGERTTAPYSIRGSRMSPA